MAGLIWSENACQIFETPALFTWIALAFFLTYPPNPGDIQPRVVSYIDSIVPVLLLYNHGDDDVRSIMTQSDWTGGRRRQNMTYEDLNYWLMGLDRESIPPYGSPDGSQNDETLYDPFEALYDPLEEDNFPDRVIGRYWPPVVVAFFPNADY